MQDQLQALFEAEDSEGLLQRGTELFRKGEESKAFEYYRAACKLGNAIAMGNLGFCYQNGRGVKPDNRMAAYCYERACELEEPGSMLKMGDFCYRGKGGVPKDRARAFGYYLRAYEISCSASERDAIRIAELCYRLGTCLKDGEGAAQNTEAAYEYFQSAAELLDEEADARDVRTEALMQKIAERLEECEAAFE